MFDHLSFDITNPVPEGFELDMPALMDITKMPLEELEEYLEGLKDTLSGMEPEDKRLPDLKTLMAEVEAQIKKLKK